MGYEIIQDSSGTRFCFSHDSVTLRFEYRVDEIPDKTHALTSAVQNEQRLSSHHYMGPTEDKITLASLGPFATWKILVVCGGGVI